MQEFQDHNNCSFFTIANQSESDINILLVHGYAEHIMRYEAFFDALDAAGFNVLGYDHRGHGQTDGQRAMIDSFDTYVKDMRAITNTFFSPNKKNFIFAHSMGGLITTLYLERYGAANLAGVVLSGSALVMYEKTPAIVVKLAGAIATLFPNLPTVPAVADVVSRDQEIVEKYKKDPLIFNKRTKAKMGHEFLKAQQVAIADLAKINVPIFINHGAGDILIDPQSSQLTFDKISSEDKTLRIWDGLYHEILNEPEKEEVTKEIIDWIKAHSN